MKLTDLDILSMTLELAQNALPSEYQRHIGRMELRKAATNPKGANPVTPLSLIKQQVSQADSRAFPFPPRPDEKTGKGNE